MFDADLDRESAMEDYSHGSSSASAPAPFLTKTYDMVDDASTDSIVSWSNAGNSFIIWNALEFARDLLPKFFKHSNFSSFVRQLNTYGFHKIDPDQWEFANDEFIKGKKHLLKSIHRRKPVHSHSQQASTSGPLTETERQELEEMIEKLRHEKGVLVLELRRHAQQQQGMEMQMHSLEERLQNIAFRQRNIMVILYRVVQKPNFLSTLIHQHDLHSKKRRFLKTNFLSEDSDLEESLVPLQSLNEGNPDITWPVDTEPLEKLESSLHSLENFFRGISQASGGEMEFDCFISCDAPLFPSQETNTTFHPPSPRFDLSSARLEELNSSDNPEESTSYGKSPAVCHIEFPDGTKSRIPEIDVNSLPAGVNDVFWQQFLTETPGSGDPQEVQSERRDLGVNATEEKVEGQDKVWWSRRNVEHVTKQLGNLTPAERA